MGTNYYLEYDRCACCGRHETAHIGKTSAGFVTLRAYTDGDFTEGSGPIVAFGTIETWSDWKKILHHGTATAQEENGGLSHGAVRVAVRDEYGNVVPNRDLIAKVESYRMEDRRRQYDQVASHYRHYLHEYWLDPDGFTFHNGEFS